MQENETAEKSEVRDGDDESEWRRKQRKLDDNGEGRDQYLELFRNQMVVWFVKEFLGLSASSRYKTVEVEASTD